MHVQRMMHCMRRTEYPGCSAAKVLTSKETVGWKVSPGHALVETLKALLAWVRKGSPPGKKPVLTPPSHLCKMIYTHCALSNCADCSKVRVRCSFCCLQPLLLATRAALHSLSIKCHAH